MSVENVPAVVNIKTHKGTIYCTQNLYWVGGGGVKSVEKQESVAGQFAVKYKSGTYCWTKKLNRDDYVVDKYWVLFAVVKEEVKSKHCCKTIKTVALI